MAHQAPTPGPKYQRIADDLRAQIESGEYPPGAKLPTKADLMARYQVAVNTVERAIEELRRAGVVATAQGAGMFVREPQDEDASTSPDTKRLDELQAEVAALQRQFAMLQAQVMDLYHSNGREYPYGDTATEADRQVS